MDQQAPVVRETGDIHETIDAFASILASDEQPNESEALTATDETDEVEEVAAEADEAETEVDDAVDEDEAEDSADPDEEDETEDQPTYKVKINGEEVDVTIDELLSGYSRNSDYTRKTQQLAEQRKAADSELQTARSERAQYAVLLEQLNQQLQGQMQEPDWNALYQQDPNQYVLQREVWRSNQERMQALQAERSRIAQAQQADQQSQMMQMLENEKSALTAALPEWSDAELAANEKSQIKRYAIDKLGMTEAESNAIYDHRIVLALRKAYLYDKLTSKPVQPKKATSAVVKPGSKASTPKPQTAYKKATQRLAKSGNVQDAAQAFEYLL